MGCLINKKISKVCDTQVAGVKLIAAANWSTDVNISASAGVVHNIALPSGQKFYMIEGDSNAGYFNCTLQQGGNSDSKAFMHTVGTVINRLSDTIVSDYKNWMLSKLMFAVQDRNGDVYLLGADNGLIASAFDYSSGAGATDASGITVTFEGVQPNAMLKVRDWDIIKSKLG